LNVVTSNLIYTDKILFVRYIQIKTSKYDVIKLVEDVIKSFALVLS